MELGELSEPLSENCMRMEAVSVISHTEGWLNDQVYEFLAGIKFVCSADTAFARRVIL